MSNLKFEDRLTPDHYAELTKSVVAQRMAGMTHNQIADHHQIPKRRVPYILRQAGQGDLIGHLPPTINPKILARYKQGYSIKQLCTEFSLSITTITKYLKLAGVFEAKRRFDKITNREALAIAAAERDKQIIAWYKEGVNTRFILARLHLTHRCIIYRALKRYHVPKSDFRKSSQKG